MVPEFSSTRSNKSRINKNLLFRPPSRRTATVPDSLRLIREAEFIQSLTNPDALRVLVNLFQKDNNFRFYLLYLEYWRLPEYSVLLEFPACLDVLEMLNFRGQALLDHGVLSNAFAKAVRMQLTHRWAQQVEVGGAGLVALEGEEGAGDGAGGGAGAGSQSGENGMHHDAMDVDAGVEGRAAAALAAEPPPLRPLVPPYEMARITFLNQMALPSDVRVVEEEHPPRPHPSSAGTIIAGATEGAGAGGPLPAGQQQDPLRTNNLLPNDVLPNNTDLPRPQKLVLQDVDRALQKLGATNLPSKNFLLKQALRRLVESTAERRAKELGDPLKKGDVVFSSNHVFTPTSCGCDKMKSLRQVLMKPGNVVVLDEVQRCFSAKNNSLHKHYRTIVHNTFRGLCRTGAGLMATGTVCQL